MLITIVIKLTSSGPNAGPFNIFDEFGNILLTDVSKKSLVEGVVVQVEDSVTRITIESTGRCKIKKSVTLTTIPGYIYINSTYKETKTSCLWRHLTNPEIYNYFYGTVYPYVIEYPFAYKFQDEILQNIKDYTKVYKYWKNGQGVFNDNDKIELDDVWFNKAIVYNGQQSSGLLELVPKPKNNLKDYLKYPIYNTDSKVITYTKSDNFYQYNTFWSLVKDKRQQLFLTSCENLSIDKVINQSNMDYNKRSFKKEPLRAKDLKVRHILDSRSDAHLVSQFITQSSQISYK